MSTIVQDRYTDARARFQMLFETRQNRPGSQGSQVLEQYQRKAIGLLETVNFPTRRDEEWKYTSVNRLLQPDYEVGESLPLSKADIGPFLIPGLDCHLFVFVNGIFQESLSDTGSLPAGLTAMDIAGALADEQARPAAEAALNRLLDGKTDAFKLLNAAFSQHGLFIRAARNAAVEKPLYLLHLSASGDKASFHNHMNLVAAEPNSELSVIEGFFELPASEGAYFHNQYTYFHAGDNAHIHHYRLQREGREGFLVSNVEIEQEGGSTYASYALDLGGRLVRNNLRTRLNAPGTTTNYWGAYFAKGEQHIDNHTFIDHAVPHCVSNELYKGIITDRASGVFNGKVLVRKDAQKTNAFQQNNSLVLSDKASMDTKPELEIFADDVRCSHGATIGQLDEGAVFYLRSRGLPDAEARAMLQHAFLAEAAENMKLEAVRLYAEQLVHSKFGE